MGQLQLLLFGTPIVKHDETTLTFSTRKALALLVYLAVEGGVHSRKTLSEAFWLELDAQHGRAALRATLLELRRLFDRSHDAGASAHLRAERDMLAITQDDSLVLDLRLLEAASTLTEHTVASLLGQERQQVFTQLEEASRLVRGPFLRGFTLRDSPFFDDWSTQHREYWHRRASQVFDTLSRLYEQGAEVLRAIETVTRWLRFDPLSEEGYRRLMQLRFLQGDRLGALRIFSRCQKVLAADLQIEPDAQTLALARRIRQSVAVPAGETRSAQPSAGQSSANQLTGPLLGRAAPFGTLIQAYQHAQAGQPHLVVLQGEAGIGKTRLSTEFTRWAQAQGAEILASQALPTKSELPYQPLTEALRPRLERELDAGHRTDQRGLAELARLLPDLCERYPDLPAPATEERFAQLRLFEAITGLLQRWGRHRPLVLLLEDLQWADRASLDLLLYLAHRLSQQPAPLLLLLTERTEAGGCPQEHARWRLALKRTPLPVMELSLAPFSLHETQRFVQELAWAEHPVEGEGQHASGAGPASGQGGTLPEELVPLTDWLYQQTQGQPLYLVETLKELLDRGIMVLTQQDQQAWRLVWRQEALAQTSAGELIPQSVRELILDQFARLSPGARTLLMNASVLEEGLSLECLCQVAGLDELEGVDALEELLQGGWLSQGTGLARSAAFAGTAFRSPLLRQVLSQQAAPTRRWLLQRRLAAIIREGIVQEQAEEASSAQTTPAEDPFPARKRRQQGRQVVARTINTRPRSPWRPRYQEIDFLRAGQATPHSRGTRSSEWYPGQTSSSG